MTVIVVRRDDSFSQIVRGAGVEVVNLELVRPEVIEDLSEFENLIACLDDYGGVFFTSPVAARVFIDHVKPPVGPTLYALGRRAATVLEEAGFEVEKVPHANTAEEMLLAFGDDEFAGKKLLFVRGERSMRTIPAALADLAKIDEVAVYRTMEVEPAESVANEARGLLADGQIDWICFFSPSGVEAFEKRFGTAHVSAAAIGDTTAARAKDLGFRVKLVASRATNETFATELIAAIKEKRIV